MSTPASDRPAATRNDVARLAGVSPGVVSYVINGTKRVAPETRARVEDAITKLGYRPNRAARALRLGSTETIGMVVPDATDPFFTMLSREVEVAAGRRGYAMVAVNGAAGEERRLLETLVSRGIDGVIVCGGLDADDAAVLHGAGMPFVLLNQFDAVPGMTAIGADLAAGAEIAVEHLASHGHRTVGIIAGIGRRDREEDRVAGWRRAVARLGLHEGPIVSAPFTPAGGYAAMRELIDHGSVPSALFVSSDQLAKGALLALHEAGFRVPEDVAVVGFDGTRDGEYCWPPLTSVAQPVAEMADAAIAALLGAGAEPAARVFAPALVRRASCGCSPDGARRG